MQKISHIKSKGERKVAFLSFQFSCMFVIISVDSYSFADKYTEKFKCYRRLNYVTSCLIFDEDILYPLIYGHGYEISPNSNVEGVIY